MQFRGLLKKDFLLWRRNKLGSVCELVWPILFTIVMIFLNTLVKESTIEAVSGTPKVIPTNDDLLANEILNPLNPLFKNCLEKNNKGGRVALVPPNKITKKLKPLFEKFNYETFFFDSREEAEKLTQSSEYTTPFDNSTWRQFCFIVEFSKFESQQYEYTLRFNVSGPWPRKDHWDTLEPRSYLSFVKDDQNSFLKAKEGGLFLLKNFIDNQILKTEENKTLKVGLDRFKVDPYNTSDLYDIMPMVVSLLLVFLLIFPLVRIVGQVVSDRESLVLQNMENMGMKKYVYFWSTLTFFYIKSFLIVLIITLLVKFLVLKDIGFFILFFMFLFGSYCYINIGFFISCFFIQSKKAIITGIVIFFALNLGSLVLSSVQDSQSAVLLLVIISPNINMEIIKDAMLRAQTNFSPLNLTNMDNLSYRIPIYTLFIILLLQFIFTLLIGLYCFYTGTS